MIVQTRPRQAWNFGQFLSQAASWIQILSVELDVLLNQYPIHLKYANSKYSN